MKCKARTNIYNEKLLRLFFCKNSIRCTEWKKFLKGTPENVLFFVVLYLNWYSFYYNIIPYVKLQKK